MSEQAALQFYPEKTVGGITGWHWPSVDVQTFDFIKGDWENSHRKAIMNLLHATHKPFDTVIQAGGNCGMYPKLLASIFKHVYTFEPDPLNFYTLGINCNADNIFKIQAALGPTGGFVSMIHRTMMNVGMHQVIAQPASKIPMIALDTLPFEGVDLIWLDIEEYEINALKGAVNTINNNKPFVFCENPTEEVTAFLKQACGYQLIGQSKMDGVYYHEPLV